MKDNRFIITLVENPTPDGLRAEDVLVKVNGGEVTLQNARDKYLFMMSQKVGTIITLTVERNGEERDIKVIIQPRLIKHQFKILDNATEKQLELRNAWLKNL